MPHYKDGTLATLGEVVRGKGYNVPDEITGIVVGIEYGKPTCNIQIAHNIRPVSREDAVDRARHGNLPNLVVEGGSVHAIPSHPDDLTIYSSFGRWFTFDIEHGEAGQFQKVIAPAFVVPTVTP